MTNANDLDDENTAKAEIADLIQSNFSASNSKAQLIAERIAAIYEPVFVDQFAEGHKEAIEALEDEAEAESARIVTEAYDYIKAALPDVKSHPKVGDLHLVALSEAQLAVLGFALESFDASDSEYAIANAIANDLSGYLPKSAVKWDDVEFEGDYDEIEALREKLYPR